MSRLFGFRKNKDVPKRKDIPYYLNKEDIWKVEIDVEQTEGDLYWCVSEMIRDSLFYKYADGDHGHYFEEVFIKIMENPEWDGIEGNRSQYSEQELEMIDKWHAKIKELHGDSDGSI